MKTSRFETFFDAILAIIITVLVLKFAVPTEASWYAVLRLNTRFITYLTMFLIIYNIWYNNHNLFQLVDEIDNKSLIIYGVLIFLTSLYPYFGSWISLYLNSTATETMFGVLVLLSYIVYYISVYSIHQANKYNKKLDEMKLSIKETIPPFIILLIGFILTYTVYTPGIYVCSLISILLGIFFNHYQRIEILDSARFEAFFDAIVAIIITIVVLELPMAATGTWDALINVELEFVAYAISFIVCFNFWNYNNNIFNITNRVDYKVIWTTGISLFVLSLIPFLTTFVSLNFNSFVPQFLYGLDFIVVALLSTLTAKFIKEADEANIALQILFKNHYATISTVIIVSIAMLIGYLFYPPIIIISCLLSIFVVWIISRMNNRC